jgi:hypothetical protein
VIQKRHENVPFRVFDGFLAISATLLGRNGRDDELATSAVTEHLDLEFQALAGTRGMQKHNKQGKGTLNVPALFPDSSVGIPKPTSGRIGADVLAQLQQSSKD